MSGLAVVINRAATRIVRDRAIVEALYSAAGPDATVIETHDLAELDAAARQVRHANPDVVALCGGDGTYMSGLTALRSAYGRVPLPAMAFVPCGAVSTIARNFGVSGSPVAELARVAAAVQSHEIATVEHPTVDANGKVGSIFGTALVANFFDVYHAERGNSYADAARIVARIFAESFVGGPYARRVLEPIACRVEVDGVQLSPERYSLICCATVKDLGLHMIVNYRAGERDDAMHLVASALPTRKLGPQMFRVLAGRRLHGTDHFDGLVREFRVTFPETYAWVLDGDVFHDRAVRVRCGPKVRVVRGVGGSADVE